MPSELAQTFKDFGPWDWACIIANFSLGLGGIFALKCWRQMPDTAAYTKGSTMNASISLGTALLAFGIVFPLMLQWVAQACATTFGISQAYIFVAAFAGQLTAAGALITVGGLIRGTLHWAPSDLSAETSDSDFTQAFKAFSLPRLLLAILCIFALGIGCALLWKGVHIAWEQLFLHGWAGQPPADEPQDIVNSVLKTDVGTWRFATITLAVAVGAPIMEELAFRGMLYPGVRQLLGVIAPTPTARWIAVILTGAVFSAAHLSASAAIPLFAFGAFMCLVRDRYGLLVCMGAHASFNLWNLVWLKLAPNASNL
jgi:membrane protease YdiL (CAAX protease family)